MLHGNLPTLFNVIVADVIASINNLTASYYSKSSYQVVRFCQLVSVSVCSATGLPLHVTVPLTALVCTVYTALVSTSGTTTPLMRTAIIG